MPSASEMSKGRKIVSTVLLVLPAIAMIASSLMKFAHVPAIVSQMGEVGFSDSRLMLIAVLEIVSAALLLVPRTRAVGILMVSAFLGGAIATHIGHAQSPAPPVALLALAWAGVCYRHPAALWNLRER